MAEEKPTKSYGGECMAHTLYLVLICDVTQEGFSQLSIGQSKDEAIASVQELLIASEQNEFSIFDRSKYSKYDAEAGTPYNSGYEFVRCSEQGGCDGELGGSRWFINGVKHSRWKWSYSHTGGLVIDFDENDRISSLKFEACICP